jgi:hypothetical protein
VRDGEAPPNPGSEVADAGPCRGHLAGTDDACTALPRLTGTPVIDGLPDCSVALSPLTPVGWTGGAAEPDVVAQYAAAWLPGGLYVYVLVTDPSAVAPRPSEPVDSGDGVEIYFDADGRYDSPPLYDEPGTRRIVVAAPVDATATAPRVEIFTDRARAGEVASERRYGVFPRSFGYVVEAFVTARDLGLSSLGLSAGGSVGWGLALDVSYPDASTTGPDGHRLGRYFLHTDAASAGSGVPVDDVGAFCTATLMP